MGGIAVGRGVHRPTASLFAMCASFLCSMSRGLPVLEPLMFYFTGTSLDWPAAIHTAQLVAGGQS